LGRLEQRCWHGGFGDFGHRYAGNLCDKNLPDLLDSRHPDMQTMMFETDFTPLQSLGGGLTGYGGWLFWQA